jgi:fibronectin type 3 domain-containing protein
MRWRAPVSFTLTASAALLLACSGERPVAPSLTPEGAGIAMASALSVAPPSNVSAVAHSDGRIDVTWQETSTNESGFEVHRSTTGSAGPFALLKATGANAVAHSDVGLQTGAEYCYSVRAVRTVGNKIIYSAFANVVCATATPTAPSNATAMTVASSDAQINLAWQDNSSVEAGYEIQRSQNGATGPFQLLATTASNVAAYSDQSVQPVAQYCYQIRALGVIGNGASNSSFTPIVCVTTPPPTAPSNATAMAVASSDAQINLTWQDNSSVEAGYEIHRSQSGATGTFQLLATTASNIAAYSDRSVVPVAQYCYQIRAMGVIGNGASASAFTNITCATTPPSPPVSGYTVGVKPWSSSRVGVSVKWTDVSAAALYRMYRSTDGGSAWDLITLTGSDGVFADYRPSEQATCYRVVAYNAGGDAAPSNTACATPPAGPTDLVATIVDAQTLELTWTDNSSVEGGYQLWVRYYRGSMYCYPEGGATDAGTYEGEMPVADLPANSTTYLATQWSDGGACFPQTFYWFYIVATKDGGRSDPSNEVDASIAPPPPPSSSSTHALLEKR